MKTTSTITSLLISLFLPLFSLAQETVIVKVLDSQDKKPVTNAQVYLNGQKTQLLTNFRGYFQITLPEQQENEITVEHENYSTLTFIAPKTSGFTIELDKKEINICTKGMKPYFMTWCNRIKYPISAAKSKIHGVTFLLFEIDETGNMADRQILNSLSPDFDKEILSVSEILKTDFIPDSSSTKYIQPFFFKYPDKDLKLPDMDLPTAVFLPEVIIYLSKITTLKRF